MQIRYGPRIAALTRGAVISVVLSALTACKGGDKSPVAPTSTTPHIVTDCPDPVQYNSASCPTRTAVAMAIRARAVVNGADVPWSYTFAGLTISGTGSQWTVVEGLSPIDYEVAGQFQQVLFVEVSPMEAPRVPGQFNPNSFVSLEGPVASRGCKFINYGSPSDTPTPKNFRFKFAFLPQTSPTGPLPCP